MKSFLRKQSISLKCLVITLLLSFIGQAVALPDVCIMEQMGVSNEGLDEGMPAMAKTFITTQDEGDLPCHTMSHRVSTLKNADQGVDQSSASPNQNQVTMDCCDSPMMTDSSCSCPDNGCSGSVPFFSQNITDSSSYSEHRSYYAQPRFPTQINSALFRPPIV